jgi:hypothetical protein
MTDEQINAAIAEACGWRKEGGVYMWTAHGIDCTYPELWDWANDLNAMHEAEKTIFPYYATVYANKLAQVTGAEMSDDTVYFCAVARQRAEAFLRALGKWEQPTPEESSGVE